MNKNVLNSEPIAKELLEYIDEDDCLYSWLDTLEDHIDELDISVLRSIIFFFHLYKLPIGNLAFSKEGVPYIETRLIDGPFITIRFESNYKAECVIYHSSISQYTMVSIQM